MNQYSINLIKLKQEEIARLIRYFEKPPLVTIERLKKEIEELKRC